MRFITAIPILNEEKHLEDVLAATRAWSRDVLVVDDGSTDCTPCLLERYSDIQVIRHEYNEGYGAAIGEAFRFAIDHNYELLVTMDCDGQHEPSRIPELVSAVENADIVSGSRYLKQFEGDSKPPEDRRTVNGLVTSELNRRFGLRLTDSFCGFKAYRSSALRELNVTEAGYGMPMEVWVQAAKLGLSVKEIPVPLIYCDEERAFGGALDNAERRMAYYFDVIERAVATVNFAGKKYGRSTKKHCIGESR